MMKRLWEIEELREEDYEEYWEEGYEVEEEDE